MYKLPFIVLLSILLLSCSNKSNADEKKESEKEEVVSDKTEDSQPKSKYEIRQALAKFFTRIDRGNAIQVIPSHVGKDGNGLYCYFLEKGKRIISLSLHIQYAEYNADFYELVLGDEVMKYESNKSQQSEINHVIAESTSFKWYDKMINEEDEAFLRKIGETGRATLRLYKSSGESLTTIQLSKTECKALVDAIDYYIALNGAKIPKKGMVNIRSF